MRNQKVNVDSIRVPDPTNKLRRDIPQIQAPVKPKAPGKQLQVNAGVAALQSMFKKNATGKK